MCVWLPWIHPIYYSKLKQIIIIIITIIIIIIIINFIIIITIIIIIIIIIINMIIIITPEHTEMLTYMINHTRKRQRSLVATLIDLSNAIGEVHHSLLRRVLDFHHMLHELRELILEMYKDFYVTIGTMGYTTCPIKVERGLLQGDCLSLLLFNLCFNTLIQTVKQWKVNCLVFDYTLQPRHWLQFADDATNATSSVQDNQYLLNLFIKWSIWANFVAGVNKCKSFGITKECVSIRPI